MQFETHTPAQCLQPFVKAYMVIESDTGSTNRIVPDTSFALALRLRGKISYLEGHHKTPLPPVCFSGLRKSVRLIDYAPGSAAIIVLFKETGVPAFFKQPLYELFDRSVNLDYFFPSSEIAALEQLLAESSCHSAAITVIEAFLISKLTGHRPDALVSEAVSRMHTANGNISIKEFAKTLYLSQDAFEKRFRKITGASPKQFSKILKLNSLIHQKFNKTSLSDLVFDNGYFDHAHFIKDFKVFTGQTPTDFFKSPHFW
ncbi:MAG TPA: DUF6597 domain-containing transcriptional factor [Arachidicoccus sp.]|nr:DUF6597 domain-containing transcriptional factor [Arachidicoccus sp.]